MPALNPNDVLADASCYVCYGASTVEALELGLLDVISQNIGGGVVVTNHILTEGGDNLAAENGNLLTVE